MPTNRSYRIDICQDINQVCPRDWNRVVRSASATAFHSHEWLQAYEKAAPHQSQAYHLLTYCGSQLVGVTPAYLTQGCPRLTAYRKHLVETEPAIAEPLLLGHTFYSYYGGPLLAQADADLMAQTIEAFESLAHDLGVEAFGFVNVAEDNIQLLDRLRAEGYAVRYVSSSMYLPITWSSFEEYLTHLSKTRRRNIRRGERKARECQLTCEWAAQAADIDELETLFLKTLIKYNHADLNLFPRAYFQAILEIMADLVRLLLVRDSQGNLVRYSLILDFNGYLQPWIAGIDYETINTYEHSRFLYSKLIKYAIGAGHREIDMGRGAYRLKTRYGCLRRVLFLALKSTTPDKSAEVDRWSREIEKSRLDRYLGHFDDYTDDSHLSESRHG